MCGHLLICVLACIFNCRVCVCFLHHCCLAVCVISSCTACRSLSSFFSLHKGSITEFFPTTFTIDLSGEGEVSAPFHPLYHIPMLMTVPPFFPSWPSFALTPSLQDVLTGNPAWGDFVDRFCLLHDKRFVVEPMPFKQVCAPSLRLRMRLAFDVLPLSASSTLGSSRVTTERNRTSGSVTVVRMCPSCTASLSASFLYRCLRRWVNCKSTSSPVRCTRRPQCRSILSGRFSSTDGSSTCACGLWYGRPLCCLSTARSVVTTADCGQ